MKKFFDWLGTAFMVALGVTALTVSIAGLVYSWQTGDWEGRAITRAVGEFEASLLPAQKEEVTTAPSCVEWSWMNGKSIYTMKEEILSVDEVTDYEILVTVETCGRTGPGRLYLRTREDRDAVLSYIRRGGEFEITRYGRNDMVISIFKVP